MATSAQSNGSIGKETMTVTVKSQRNARGWRMAAVTAVVIAGFGIWQWSRADHARKPGPVAARSAAQRAAVPVVVVTPARQDVPVYAVGLGSVQASQTIAIHSQIDGKLEQVLFTEGQFVKRGDVLARIDPRLYKAALDLARAKRAQDAALLVAAQKDLTRFKTLALKSFQSQQSIDNQQAKVDQLLATIAADEASIESAQTQLDYTMITAPTDGRVGVRLIDAGNFVRAADPGAIATLMLTRPSAVMFSLPAQQLDAVREAMARGPVEVTAFDQDNRKALSTGTLLLVDNAIDSATAMIRLKAIFPNTEDRLWPGQFVNARILLETRASALTVPNAVIQRGPQGLFAWVIDETGLAVVRKLELGPANDTRTVVLSGLADTDRVVLDGQYKLQIGAPVSIAPVAQPAASVGGRS